jgi:predicted flavoprotein YhiN
MNRLTLAGIAVAWCLAVGVLSGHDDYRIVGTLTKIAGNTIDVKQTKDGKVFSMDMDSQTIITRDKKKVEKTELKVGANVVVDASGDALDDLLVLEIRLVPAPKGK